jgi:hypothetical protein
MAALLWRCKKDVGPPLTGLPALTPKPAATVASTQGPPIFAGSFRVVPAANPSRVIPIGAGNTVEVNAVAFRDQSNVALRLGVDWGEGSHDSSACGACRVSHVYPTTGTFTVTALVTDFSSDRIETWTVQVI